MPANDYYDSTGAPSNNATVTSTGLRTEFDAIETGFTAVQAALALKAALASPVLVTPNLGTPSAGVVTNLTGTAAGVSIGGNAATATLAATVTTNANLTGDVTSVGNATTLTNAPVIAKVLTGYVSGAGTVAATDTILQAIQKLNGNNATNANLTGPITSSGNATAIASQTGTGTTFVMSASPTVSGTFTEAILVGTDTTDSSSSTTGAAKFAGGVGIAKKLYVGTDLAVVGNTTLSGTFSSLPAGGSTTKLRMSGQGIFGTGQNTIFGIGAYDNEELGSPQYAAAFGYQALKNNEGGSYDTALGYKAGYGIQSGAYCTAVGALALASIGGNANGNNNTAIGYGAGTAVTSTGANNSLLGYQAGYGITTGSNNVCLGSSSGYDAVVSLTTQSNYVVIGNNNTANANIKVAWTVTSDMRDKTNFAEVPHGLSFVNALTPTAYQYNTSRTDNTPAVDGKVRYGFLAQDILAVEGDNPVVIDNRDPDNLKFNESSLIPILVKAIQELSEKVDLLTNN